MLVLVAGALFVGAPGAFAWPADLSQRIAKDALKLVPKSLAEVLTANEVEIFADARTSSMEALPMIYLDLASGRLSTSTKEALTKELGERVKALQSGDFGASVIALGATYRLAVDLADPAVSLGLASDPRGKAIRREFYLFVAANRDKIPLVVVDPEALRIKVDGVPALLAEAAERTRARTALLLAEGQENGRVLAAREIDFRSPVFAVASIAYSRSVNLVAATWLAIWRSAGGDMMRQQAPRTITPKPNLFDQDKP